MVDSVRVGVDIGGTFTDVVTVDDGTIVTEKVPSTPTAPADAVTTGVEQAVAAGDAQMDAVGFLAHGTTVATNAVLEGDWADTGLVTTEGFRDVLEIGRQARPDIYDLEAEKPSPVVPRHHRIGVPERVGERGTVVESLDEAAVREAATTLSGVDSVAVCFLFAYEHPDHERRAADILAEELDVPVSASVDVLPEIREYERTLTTAVNAGLRPVVAEYLARLGDDLEAMGIEAPLTIMGSAGGVMSAEEARTRPVTTLLSGPAAGVHGAVHVAGKAGYHDLVTMDMGGTSCDVSLVTDGEPTVSTEVTVGDYPIGIPMVDIHTVGAGGGSIAWVDDGGALRVGPQSAGADPGPVCYGRGGTTPTTTDAQAILGRIDPDRFLEAPADRDVVVSAFEETVMPALDGGIEDAAAGVVSVANANLERALRVVSVERGQDPRHLTLVAYGGAGPLHAPHLAAALDIPRVVVPPSAGVLSALGLLVSDVAADVSASMVRAWDRVDPATVEETFTDLREEATDRLAAADVDPADRSFDRYLDVRYAGQSYDLSIATPADLDASAMTTVAERFHDRHEERYGHAAPDEPVELVTVRLRGRGDVPTPTITPTRPEESLESAITETRPVYFAGDHHDTTVYDRALVPPETTIDGPAVLEGGESTALVHPDHRGRIDEHANLIVEVDP